MKGVLSVLPRSPTPRCILIDSGSRVQVGAEEHWEEAAGTCAQWRGEPAMCMCPSKPFHDRCTWGKPVCVRSLGHLWAILRRPAERKALSASAARAQQLSSSALRHWKAPGIWSGQPLPLTPPQPDRLGHERESLLQTELPEQAVTAGSCGKG